MFSKSEKSNIYIVAANHGIKPESLEALGLKESNGRVFWKIDGVNFPAIRFEGHYFYRYLKHQPQKLKQAINKNLAHRNRGVIKNPNRYGARYDLLNRAIEIDEDAAIKSTSFGWGQVMGANYLDLGYSSPSDLMKEAMEGLKGQTELVVRYIEANNLVDTLNSLPNRAAARKFARAYNGPAYADNQYDTKLIKLYNQITKGDVVAVKTKDIQKKLKALGYNPGPVDGRMGPLTESAITQFQHDNGITPDGDAGPMTINELNSNYARLKEKKTKKIVGPLAAGGAATTWGVNQIADQLSNADLITSQASSIWDTLASSLGTIAPLIVALAVGALIFYLINRKESDD